MHFLQAEKTLDKQSRAGQQHQRENNFDYHQNGAGPSAMNSLSRAAGIFIERARDVRMRCAPRRQKSGHQCGAETNQCRERNDVKIGGDFGDPRNVRRQKCFQ